MTLSHMSFELTKDLKKFIRENDMFSDTFYGMLIDSPLNQKISEETYIIAKFAQLIYNDKLDVLIDKLNCEKPLLYIMKYMDVKLNGFNDSNHSYFLNNNIIDAKGNSILHYYIYNRYCEKTIMQLINSLNIDIIYEVNNNGDTCFTYALNNKNKKICLELLKHPKKCLLDVQDNNGQTFLMKAIKNNMYEVINIMLENIELCKIDACDKNNRNVLFYWNNNFSYERDSPIKILDKLLNKANMFDVNKKDSNDKTFITTYWSEEKLLCKQKRKNMARESEIINIIFKHYKKFNLNEILPLAIFKNNFILTRIIFDKIKYISIECFEQLFINKWFDFIVYILETMDDAIEFIKNFQKKTNKSLLCSVVKKSKYLYDYLIDSDLIRTEVITFKNIHNNVLSELCNKLGNEYYISKLIPYLNLIDLSHRNRSNSILELALKNNYNYLIETLLNDYIDKCGILECYGTRYYVNYYNILDNTFHNHQINYLKKILIYIENTDKKHFDENIIQTINRLVKIQTTKNQKEDFLIWCIDKFKINTIDICNSLLDYLKNEYRDKYVIYGLLEHKFDKLIDKLFEIYDLNINLTKYETYHDYDFYKGYKEGWIPKDEDKDKDEYIVNIIKRKIISTLLIEGIKYSNNKVIRYAMDRPNKCSLDFIDKDNNTALIYACENLDIELCNEILDYPELCNFAHKKKDGKSALSILNRKKKNNPNIIKLYKRLKWMCEKNKN